VIVALSSSSPIASVALLSDAGDLLFSAEKPSAWNASGVLVQMLEDGLLAAGCQLSSASLFLADVGPGSFIGVRVGVTLAKTFGFAQTVMVGGASSFDLISPDQTVVLPSKKGEFFVRRVGSEPIRTSELPEEQFVGFGPGIENELYPKASSFSSLLRRIKRVAPELLMPEYHIEPSISIPKKPFPTREGNG
jgi:tRNA threonylcarbamoyl adenosine modification protein YeaZ